MTAAEILNLLIDWTAALDENRRRDRFARARSSQERLFHLGVLTTCDDEMERAYQWAHAEEQAKLAGVSTPAMRDALDYCRAADGIVEFLARVYGSGETDAEFLARVRVAADSVTDRIAPGSKKSCRHNDTKTARGMMQIDKADWQVTTRYVCCRCGAEVQLSARPTSPTPNAIEAGRLVAILSRGSRAG